VTNTGDNGGVNPPPGAGTGTLRQAIVDAGAAGTGTTASPDRIQFNIPTSDVGYNSTTGAYTIQPLSALPAVTDTVTIDGYIQPEASPNTLMIGDNAVLKIVVDGSRAGAVDGLVIGGGNSTVSGLVIGNFAYGSGIVLNGSGNDVVTGSFIGTDVTGEFAASNNIGINSNSSGDRIGGTSPGDRNIISGNDSALPDSADGGSRSAGYGIRAGNGDMIQGNYVGTDKNGRSALSNYYGIIGGSNDTIGGPTTTPGTGAGNLISGNASAGVAYVYQTIVAGNLIGTTATGMAALGNDDYGIYAGNNNVIGGTTAGARNVISGNFNPIGVFQVSIGSDNLVEGNYIGTDITGTTNLNDETGGIGVIGAANIIGGTTATARNIISGNKQSAEVFIGGSSAFENVVQGNYIGTDVSGMRSVGNNGTGIQLNDGAYDNTIGGTSPGAGNIISGNNSANFDSRGIFIIGSNNNLIQGNIIGGDRTETIALSNGEGVEIDGANNNTIGGTVAGAGNIIACNYNDGVTVDSGTGNSILGNAIFANSLYTHGTLGIDLGGGGNDGLAAPVLTALTGTAPAPTVSGTLQSLANTTFRIEFYVSTDNRADGQTLVDSTYVTTDANGYAAIPATNLAALPPGQQYITATATVATLSGGTYTYGDTSGFSPSLVMPNPFNTGPSYTVTNTLDDGSTGSLRWAIDQVNADSNLNEMDAINFDIPGTGVQTIYLSSALPLVMHPVLIDGYTQPGASPNTLTTGDNAVLNVVLDGSQAGPVDGLVLESGNSTVRGLVIDNFAAAPDGGLVLSGSGNDVVRGNFIGTDPTGESAVANSNGISTSSPDDTIGGTAPGDRNIISGNNSAQPGNYAPDGIFLGSYDLIEGNYIGTDKSGTLALSNHLGIFGGDYETIGGSTAGAGNVISGNTGDGIFLSGSQNVIAGNLIGTTANGLAVLGNGYGIHLWGNYNKIGGTTTGARNIISGNDGDAAYGIGIEAVSIGGGQHNLIEGNYIGTDITGTVGLGHNQIGITIFGCYNTVGGTTAATRNIISGVGVGILLQGGASSFQPTHDNVVDGNYIGTDVSGTQGVGNFLDVFVFGNAYENLIGGPLPGEGNVICASEEGGGIVLRSSYEIGPDGGPPTGNLIQGNLIGTDKTGTLALGPSDGIYLVGADNTMIGGTTPGAGNTIAYTHSDNAAVDIESGTGDSVLGNSIFMNTAINTSTPHGIFLNSANDANDNRAAPVLTGGSASASGTSVSGTLASVADTTFRIEFFANAGLDASGNAEGQTYLGFATVTTDNNGDATFTAANLAAIPAGEGYLTATATVATLNLDGTSTYGDTSPFSNYLAVPTSLQLTSSANPSLFGLPVTFTATLSASLPGFGTPTTSVEFVDSTTNTNLGTVPLSGGIASLTTSSLAVGTHVVSATYVGGGIFLGSSASLTQTVIPPASLSGIVWEDFNDDGQVDFGEPGVSGVTITLTGTDDLGNSVNLSQPTDGDGAYVFLNLRPGSYYITETPPAGYLQGIDSIGTAGGSLAATDQFFVRLAAGVNGLNYNFGEQPAGNGPVQKGRTATIGFWNNNNGQALIKAFNGGPASTHLADWLAGTLPNMFGVNAGSNNLTGQSNANVAALFQQDFVLKGVKLDAQVLATALSVYATNATLDSTTVAAQYGFIVSGDGVGTAAINVSCNGDAFGVANNTTLTVMDLLLATDNQAINGLLYGGNATKRNEANNVYSAINQGGDIS
jgi:hypothetical protein